MSRVYFHSLDGEAAVAGPERHRFAAWAARALAAALQIDGDSCEYSSEEWLAAHLRRLAAVITPAPPAGLTRRDFRHWLTGASLEQTLRFAAKGELIDGWSCELNTLLATGSDPLVLAARIHGQCELHAWVDGPNRAWLAEIVERGLACGLYRPGMGWDQVVALLRSGTEREVVTSYSVCEQFPNLEVALEAGTWKPAEARDGDEDDDLAREEWDAMSNEEQWLVAMLALRAAGPTTRGLELRPDSWRWPDFFFGSAPTTAHNVYAAAVAGDSLTGGGR